LVIVQYLPYLVWYDEALALYVHVLSSCQPAVDWSLDVTIEWNSSEYLFLNYTLELDCS
jgi:hypothetical protein